MSDFIISDNSFLLSYTGPGGDIVIPDIVKFYSSDVFYGYRNIGSVTLPDASSQLPINLRCTSYVARETNKHFSTIDGVLYNKDKTVLKAIPRKRTGKFVIPSSVESASSIMGIMLSELVLPEGFQELHMDGLKNLKSLILPDSLTKLSIVDAPQLKSLVIPQNVKKFNIGAPGFIEMLEIKNPDLEINNYFPYSQTHNDRKLSLLCLIHPADKPLSEYKDYKRPISMGIVLKKYRGMPVSDESFKSALTYIKRNKDKYEWMKLFIHDLLFIRFAFDYKLLKDDQLERCIDELIEIKTNEDNTELVTQILELKDELYPSSEQFDRLMKKAELEMKKAEKEIIYQERLKDKTSKEYMKTIWSFTSCGDDCVKIHKYLGDEINVEVPDYIGGKKVIEITDNAFSPIGKPNDRKNFYKYKLQSVSIPNTVKKLGKGIFKSCERLTKVHILSETINTIPREAFKDCTFLVDVMLPNSVTKIEDYAFSNCKRMEKIDIPRDTVCIGEYAFAGCELIKNLMFPPCINSIQNCSFAGCSSLKNIVAPITVKKDIDSVLDHSVNFINVNYYDPV